MSVTPLSLPAARNATTTGPILIADDDEGVCLLLESSLQAAGYETVCLSSGAAVEEWLSRHRARLLLLDVRLADMDAAAVLDRLARAGTQVPFVVISGLSDTKIAVEYMRRGALDYLIKDTGFLDLVPTVVSRALRDIARDEELQHLQREILEISEREQQRIGQDIHDDICQRLAAVKMKLQHLSDKLAKTDTEAAAEAAEISYHLGEATRAARALARGLSPVDIGHEGLAAALSGLARTAEEIFHFKCRLRVSGECPKLDHHVATQLYRITQECLANAAKHAEATVVEVRLAVPEPEDPSPAALVLTITNNGKPFPSPPPRTGLGLYIMRQRAASMNAGLEFLPVASGGTKVKVTLPNL